MKMNTAMEIINKPKPAGFMVSFEQIKGRLLCSDHFPDKHAGEDLIPTETEAWELAERFADATAPEDVVNIYVIDHDFRPVENYATKKIRGLWGGNKSGRGW